MPSTLEPSLEQHRSSLIAPSLRERHVARHREQPRREPAGAVKSADAPLESDQDFLCDVVRGVLVVGEPRRPPAHAILHAGDEPLHRGWTSRANSLDERRQIAVVALSHDHR